MSDRDGDYDVYSVSADGRRVGALTRNKANDSSPVLSANGRWIAVHRAGTAAVLIRSDGRQERTVGPDTEAVVFSPVVFSPDGRWLAVSRENWRTERRRIELVPVGSGRIRRLGAGAPTAFSTDGRRLAFSEWDYNRAGVVEVSTGRRTVLRNVGDLDDREEWSPNLTGVAFTRDTHDMSDDREELVVITTRRARPRVLARGEPYVSFRWLGEKRLGFERPLNREHRELVVVSADGTGRRVIARGKIGTSEWSPGGDRVAYSVNDGRALTVASIDSQARRTIKLPGRAINLTWSPTGRRLAVTIETPAYRQDLLIVDALRGVVQLRARGLGPGWWSPDEATIATAKHKDEIVLLSVATGRERRAWSGGNIGIVGWMRGPLPSNAPRAVPPPPPEARTRYGFASRSSVLEIASDGDWVGAIVAESALDCQHVVAWLAGSASLVRFTRPARCEEGGRLFRQLALRGTTLRWINYFCGTGCYVISCAVDVRTPGRYGDCIDSDHRRSADTPPNRLPPPAETHGGVAFSVRGGAIALRRATDGRVRTIRPPGSLVDAELERSGLFYAYNVGLGRFRGHVVFVPFRELFR